MKRTRIVQAVLIIAAVAFLSSCSSERYYPSRSHTDVSLIIGPSPGLYVMRHPNGMYYYRDPRGYIYWRGYGNRYYLDRRYMKRSYYHNHQYNEWRRYHGRRR